jgi:4-aminobutyrate aminotransferase-like enzyme/Ser/Thr protein kinase RdoA (MazF antagonist)
MSGCEQPGDGGVLETPAPGLTIREAEHIALDMFGISARARLLDSERDQNFQLSVSDGNDFVLKISNPAEDAAVIDLQAQALLWIAKVDSQLPVPRIRPTKEGQNAGVMRIDQRDCLVRVVSYLQGLQLADATSTSQLRQTLGSSLARLDLASQGFFHSAAGHVLLWDLKHAGQLRQYLDTIPDARRRSLAEHILDRFTTHIEPAIAGLRAQIIHNDFNPGNVLVDPDDHDCVTGIIDFGDMVHAPLVNDVAVAAAYQTLSRDDPVASACELIAGYHAVNPLLQRELELLPMLIMTRLVMGVVISSWRSQQHPDNIEYIAGDQLSSWEALEKLVEIDVAAMSRTFSDACGPSAAGGYEVARDELPETNKALTDRRHQFLGESLRLSYEQPLRLVKGEGVWLFDSAGRRFLDAYNNVAHVGHCHPEVVSAISRQASLLNTNTRYLHADIVDLAAKIADTMPGDLSVCMFVCTGSEANDLAWRLARSVTGGSGAIVTDNAYHGNTTAVNELSPEELTGRRPEPWVATVPAPNSYNGPYRDNKSKLVESAKPRIGQAIEELSDRGHPLAAFMFDTVYTSDGIRIPPEGFLESVFGRIRKAGGVCIADEVQAGFGRTGEFMWGFQRHGVVPDIVTLGKPIGNGHPIAAVVTTPEIAAFFARSQYYFNTFGGNPVAAAAGLAVLDVMTRERLQENAIEVGEYLRCRIRTLSSSHLIIGDIRGAGLFTGVELVADRDTRQAATGPARRVINEMRRNGVLMGLTGEHSNVLKIRPPMVFSRANADLLCDKLTDVLANL